MCTAAGFRFMSGAFWIGRKHRPDNQAGKLVATIRSREISACLVLQAQSQLKALYKDHAETIIGNMDSIIFLAGRSEPRSRSCRKHWERRRLTPTTPGRAGTGNLAQSELPEAREGVDEHR
jgi:hypothetical protein